MDGCWICVLIIDIEQNGNTFPWQRCWGIHTGYWSAINTTCIVQGTCPATNHGHRSNNSKPLRIRRVLCSICRATSVAAVAVIFGPCLIILVSSAIMKRYKLFLINAVEAALMISMISAINNYRLVDESTVYNQTTMHS